MQKTAQKMRARDVVREKISPGGKLEEFFDPEFKDIMNKLRKVDNQIRAELTGKKIGDEFPTGSDGKPVADVDDVPNFKKYINDAEKYFNRREYMKSFVDLARFHSVVEKVHKLISEFEVELDTVHERFLFSDLVPDRYEEGSEEYARYLEELKKKFRKEKEANKRYKLVIYGGIFDFFSNIGTQRGRALSIWEKRYPKKVKALKVATKSMISAAKSLENNILKILKTMATARASRDVDNYITQAGNLISSFDSFDSKFKEYYDNHIRKFLEKQELFAPTKEVEDSKDLGNEEIDEEKNETIETSTPTEIFTPSETSSETFAPSETLVSPTEYYDSGQLELPFSDEGIGNRSLEVKDIPSETQRTPIAPEVPPAVVNPTGSIPMSQKEYLLRRQPGRPPVTPLTRMPPSPKNPLTPPTETKHILSPEDQQLRALMRETQPGKISFEPPKPIVVEHRRGVGVGRTSSEQFINSLESLSFESPLILAKYITKYAETIKDKEPETYHKLMNIVSSIEV